MGQGVRSPPPARWSLSARVVGTNLRIAPRCRRRTGTPGVI